MPENQLNTESAETKRTKTGQMTDAEAASIISHSRSKGITLWSVGVIVEDDEATNEAYVISLPFARNATTRYTAEELRQLEEWAITAKPGDMLTTRLGLLFRRGPDTQEHELLPRTHTVLAPVLHQEKPHGD